MFGISSVSPVYFWGADDPTQRALPSSAPDGFGSIKSIRAFYHGYCSAIAPIQTVIQSIKDQLHDSLMGGLCVPI
jgi:hypothetical protein